MMSALLAAPLTTAQRSPSVSRPSSDSAKPTQAWTPPRTPWGEPDLQGVYTNIDELNVPLERPDHFADRKIEDVTAEELAEFTRQSNEARRRNAEQNNAFAGLSAVDRFDLKPSRAWLVADPPDGRIPALTAEGRQRQAAFAARLNQPADSAEALNLWYRCISLGVPRTMMPSVDGAPFRIVQGPGVVAINYERMHETRVIRLQPFQPVGPTIRNYMGASQGRWEGSTLVVESKNFKGDFQMTSAASSDRRVIERFTPVARGVLEWAVTIDDPAGWTRPWTLSMLLKQTREQLFEDACHEGNHVVKNMLSAARADETTAFAEPTRATVIQSYKDGLASVRAANPAVRLSVDRDRSISEERVLTVDYPGPTADPAGRDVQLTADNRDWTAWRAIAFQVMPAHDVKLSVSFLDRNGVAYTAWTELKGGIWQLVRIPFDDIRPNPFFQPPGARAGAPLDVSDVKAIAFAPQDSTSGRLQIGSFVVAR